MTRDKQPPRDAERIRDISEAVYRLELGPRKVEGMERETDGAAKLRRYAARFDATTVRYLKALGLPVPTLEPEPITAGLFGD